MTWTPRMPSWSVAAPRRLPRQSIGRNGRRARHTSATPKVTSSRSSAGWVRTKCPRPEPTVVWRGAPVPGQRDVFSGQGTAREPGLRLGKRCSNMALELYMLGLVVHDMGTSLEFYRRLGLAIPEGSEGKTHVEVKMGSGRTFFRDSRPARWDPAYAEQDGAGRAEAAGGYRSALEFYLKTRATVHTKYTG